MMNVCLRARSVESPFSPACLHLYSGTSSMLANSCNALALSTIPDSRESCFAEKRMNLKTSLNRNRNRRTFALRRTLARHVPWCPYLPITKKIKRSFDTNIATQLDTTCHRSLYSSVYIRTKACKPRSCSLAIAEPSKQRVAELAV
jgi:hypothetical protein